MRDEIARLADLVLANIDGPIGADEEEGDPGFICIGVDDAKLIERELRALARKTGENPGDRIKSSYPEIPENSVDRLADRGSPPQAGSHEHLCAAGTSPTWRECPVHSGGVEEMVPASRDRVSEIEDAVASGAMNAMQCFTQMRQLIVKPDHSAGIGEVVVDDSMVERLARYISQEESHRCKTIDEALNHKSKWMRIVPEARKMLGAALAQPADADGAK